MNHFFFGGIEKKSTAQVLVSCQADGMMSFLEYTPSLLEACTGIENLVFDSGAHTKELSRYDIERYAQLITLLGDRCVWYASTDCIGNQKKSNENYAFLLSLLPGTLHSKILWIYQYGSDLKYLYEGLERHKRIGIGGLLSLFKKNDRSVAYHKMLAIVQIVSQFDDCIPHYFGIGRYDVISNLHHFHESFTVDASTWILSAINGKQINAYGQQCPVKKSKEEILPLNVRAMRKWVDCPPKKIDTPVYIQSRLI